MLQNYINLIRTGIEKLTSLGTGNNSFLDYIQAVGYEFAILGLGILYIIIIVSIITGPIILTKKSISFMKKRLNAEYNLMHYFSYYYSDTFNYSFINQGLNDLLKETELYEGSVIEKLSKMFNSLKNAQKLCINLFDEQDAFIKKLEELRNNIDETNVTNCDKKKEELLEKRKIIHNNLKDLLRKYNYQEKLSKIYNKAQRYIYSLPIKTYSPCLVIWLVWFMLILPAVLMFL